MIVKPPDIIYHIVGVELGKAGSDPSSIIDGDGFTKARVAHSNWKMAFTVHKRINSKKLIEGIAKETKMFPLFKGDKLSFNSIKDIYSDGDEDFLIKDEEVISIKFDRTKIEDIKTKVVLHYHYDYAEDKYQHTTESLNIWHTAFDMFEDGEESYDNMYYGIPTDEEVGDDIIEVKHIRHQGYANPHSETIVRLHQFLLSWYCNQHNTCRVKLPIRFLNIEIGDITAFPSLINGRLAYGEDYSLNNFLSGNQIIRNKQGIYPYWMVTAVSKTLDSVTLDLIQLHQLSSAGFWVYPDHPPGGFGSGIGTGELHGVDGICGVYLDYFSWNFGDSQTWDNPGYFSLWEDTPYDIIYPAEQFPFRPLSMVVYDPIYNGGQFHAHINCPGETWALYFFPAVGGVPEALDFITASKSGSDEVYTCSQPNHLWTPLSDEQHEEFGELIMRIEGYGPTTITFTVPERTQEDFDAWSYWYAQGGMLLATIDGDGVETNAFYGEGPGSWINTTLIQVYFLSKEFLGFDGYDDDVEFPWTPPKDK
jgi:hypothetical protein